MVPKPKMKPTSRECQSTLGVGHFPGKIEASSTLGMPLGKGLQDRQYAPVDGRGAEDLIVAPGPQGEVGPDGRVLRVSDQKSDDHVSGPQFHSL